jgi:hypothetical protein
MGLQYGQGEEEVKVTAVQIGPKVLPDGKQAVELELAFKGHEDPTKAEK